MTASNDNIHECCSSTCALCADTKFDDLYQCIHPDSDHYCHVFTDEHPACKLLAWRKQE